MMNIDYRRSAGLVNNICAFEMKCKKGKAALRQDKKVQRPCKTFKTKNNGVHLR